MRRQMFSCMLCLMAMVILLIYFSWYIFCCRPQSPVPPAPKEQQPNLSKTCHDCSESAIDKLMKLYTLDWKKHGDNVKEFRSQLISKCNGVSKAIITKANTPLGSNVVYDGEKRKPLKVTEKLFATFAKETPFGNLTWETCAVVGNGGVLVNSSCGEEIDFAQFIIRCNLAPVDNGYERDVGNKTHLVTANPSIFMEKYASLMERRRPFLERMSSYGDSLLLLPIFSYGPNTPVSLRVLYTLEDFESPARTVFLNPEYLRKLAQFWQAQGLKVVRLSTGIMMVSLALELCSNVHIYGFWPFAEHPLDRRPISNHYYDNRLSKKSVHTMSDEFNHLLNLHNQGVVRLHLGKCAPRSR